MSSLRSSLLLGTPVTTHNYKLQHPYPYGLGGILAAVIGRVETTDESAALDPSHKLEVRPHHSISAFGEPTALPVLASIRGTLRLCGLSGYRVEKSTEGRQGGKKKKNIHPSTCKGVTSKDGNGKSHTRSGSIH